MKRQKTVNNSMSVRLDDLLQFDPLTKNQELTYKAWSDRDNLVLTGSAGTGKTFMALYLALEDILDRITLSKKQHLILANYCKKKNLEITGVKQQKLYKFYFLCYMKMILGLSQVVRHGFLVPAS